MQPQEIQNLIDESIQPLLNEIESLKSRPLISNSLDRYIDPDSKTIINQVVRDWYKKTEETVGAGFTITPKSRYHVLTGSASRTSDTTTAIKDGYFDGQILILVGTDNTNTIIIKDAANTSLAGDATLGVGDTLTLMWDMTNWLELSRSDN